MTRGNTNYQEEPRLTKQRAQLAFDQVCKFTICVLQFKLDYPLIEGSLINRLNTLKLVEKTPSNCIQILHIVNI